MKAIILGAAVCLFVYPLNGYAQDSESKIDWDQAYEKFLAKDAALRQKIEDGATTKEEVIAWMKNNEGELKQKSKQNQPELKALKDKLDAMVKTGKLTEEQAAKLLQTMVDSEKPTAQAAKKNLDAYAEELKAAVVAGKMTKQEAIKAYREAAGAKKEEPNVKSRKRMGAKGGARPGSVNFYAIVIGKLKSKDIEIGELELDVDYVISGNATINERLVGKRVKLVGVSGAFLDNLLQIKRGDTVKIRTGDYNADKNLLGFGYKFQVLERTAPFKPEDFGVPPTEFRGFQGELTGKIVETAGYEVLLQANEIKPSEDDQASNAKSILGKRIRIGGFYDKHAEQYADLHEGDTIRVTVVHRNPSSDALNVTDVLEKLED